MRVSGSFAFEKLGADSPYAGTVNLINKDNIKKLKKGAWCVPDALLRRTRHDSSSSQDRQHSTRCYL